MTAPLKETLCDSKYIVIIVIYMCCHTMYTIQPRHTMLLSLVPPQMLTRQVPSHNSQYTGSVAPCYFIGTDSECLIYRCRHTVFTIQVSSHSVYIQVTLYSLYIQVPSHNVYYTGAVTQCLTYRCRHTEFIYRCRHTMFTILMPSHSV